MAEIANAGAKAAAPKAPKAKVDTISTRQLAVAIGGQTWADQDAGERALGRSRGADHEVPQEGLPHPFETDLASCRCANALLAWDATPRPVKRSRSRRARR